jgi:hypothetical protein
MSYMSQGGSGILAVVSAAAQCDVSKSGHSVQLPPERDRDHYCFFQRASNHDDANLTSLGTSWPGKTSSSQKW